MMVSCMDAKVTLKETALTCPKVPKGRKNAGLSNLPSQIKTGGQQVEKEGENEVEVRIPWAGVIALHVTSCIT